MVLLASRARPHAVALIVLYALCDSAVGQVSLTELRSTSSYVSLAGTSSSKPVWGAAAGASPVGDIVSATATPVCDCSTSCEVIRRRPSEALGGTQVKCGQKSGGAAQCESGRNSKVLKNLQSGVALSSQYCFLECRPIDVKLGTDCIPLTDKEAAAARTNDGGGQDIQALPAVVGPPTAAPKFPPPLPIKSNGGPVHIVYGPTSPPIVESPSQEVLAEANDAKSGAAAAAAAIAALVKEASAHADHAEVHAQEARDVVEGSNLLQAKRGLRQAAL